MFSFLFQALENYINKIRNHFCDQVHNVLNENAVSHIQTETKKKTNKLINEATISSQKEMIERTLEQREIKLDEELKPQRDIQKAKDRTREKMYMTLRQKQKEKNENEKSKKREEYVFRK